MALILWVFFDESKSRIFSCLDEKNTLSAPSCKPSSVDKKLTYIECSSSQLGGPGLEDFNLNRSKKTLFVNLCVNITLIILIGIGDNWRCILMLHFLLYSILNPAPLNSTFPPPFSLFSIHGYLYLTLSSLSLYLYL